MKTKEQVVPSFSVEEHQALLSLLKSSSLKNTDGASVHTVNNACTTHHASEFEGPFLLLLCLQK